MATKKSFGNLTEADLKGKKVFLRAGLDEKITDGIRIRASVPTIKFLTEKGAKVILGRPKGVTPKYTLQPLVPRFSELLGVEVVVANNCIGDEDVEQLADSLPDGGVLLLENARFYEEEEKDDHEFTKKLPSIADIYVTDDAFAHRGAQLEGEGLPGLFPFDIKDGIANKVMAAMKHGLPHKTSHHISSDDGGVTSHKTLPDDFAYEITGGDGSVVTGGGSGMEDKKKIHYISNDSGPARPKVKEGKGLGGAFSWEVDQIHSDSDESWKTSTLNKFE